MGRAVLTRLFLYVLYLFYNQTLTSTTDKSTLAQTQKIFTFFFLVRSARICVKQSAWKESKQAVKKKAVCVFVKPPPPIATINTGNSKDKIPKPKNSAFNSRSVFLLMLVPLYIRPYIRRGYNRYPLAPASSKGALFAVFWYISRRNAQSYTPRLPTLSSTQTRP